ncbi:MAG: hypothetical protein WAQ52_03255 [Terriglobales bacterium]
MRFRLPVRLVAPNSLGGLRLILALFLALGVAHATDTTTPTGLDLGFNRLYDLDFPGAQKEFQSWEQENPDNPMGPVSQAAGILFSEFNRLGVLESQFYANDSAFGRRKKYEADADQRARFEQQLSRAEALGRARLGSDPRDRDALLGMTLASGLRADYAALIEKRSLPSLHYTKESSAWADQLLAAHPTCYDGHLAGGISRYIVGSMAAPVRWLLRLGGVSGDKTRGIAELQTTATNGRLLAPFARILLAIAYVRDKDTPRAREVLLSLQKDFPNNHLFPRELARLEKSSVR